MSKQFLSMVGALAVVAYAEGAAVELPLATRPDAMASHAMAATSHPLATQAAIDIMKAGGSAVDGAIAAEACLGLMEPTGCGMGGDLFAIVWDPKTQKLHGYNGSGRSPRGLTLEKLRAELKERDLKQIPPRGPLPVTVPGCVDGWFALHEKFGAMEMKQVLAPAIQYAKGGFKMEPVIADGWERSVKVLKEYPGFVDQFTINGRAPRAGEVWRNPNLARTLQRIADHGRDGFYKGEIPATIESYIKSQGGFLAASDFEAHHGEWVEPVSTNYRGYDVWELPPNGQGIAALQMLNILERFDVKSMGYGTADYVHLFVEAKKLAFEDRARYYADPDFVKTPVKTLLSKAYAAERAKLIDMQHAAMSVEPGAMPSGADTIYLTVADSSGMMVSLIQSNYRGMGSGMCPMGSGGAKEGLGFILQDRGEQFALVDGHPNVYAPGKRPFHTIIPAFITKDGMPWMSFGVMGGGMQPQGHVQIVVNLIDFGMGLQQAGDVPRIHHDGSTEPQGDVKRMSDGGVLNLEPGFPEATVEELKRRGHTLKPAETPVFGGYQAIRRDAKTGEYTGASESRKDGKAAGY
ncbi:MAG TPA: gamma-glutamyltransferase [Phycisphaerales bacterium]|nr:gamma-glutamyltransferase [Phycisphaerales bacterium]